MVLIVLSAISLSHHFFTFRQVTVGGGMPIITTLRTLLNSGDKIRRVDGIFSVAMSYIMFRISPPLDSAKSVEFDREIAHGVFQGDIELPSESASFSEPCLFSQAVEEAVALGLTEKDFAQDLSNEYTVRAIMCLAKELGLDSNFSREDIQAKSEVLAHGLGDDVDEKLRLRVEAAAKRGCVLRHVGYLDVAQSSINVQIMEVPQNHVFATTPPSCEIVRFFTNRFQPYPLVIAGPAAGADCTSSALLAEVISLMSTKLGPKAGKLSRTGSSAFLM
jgi:homoserine dehydrogenase